MQIILWVGTYQIPAFLLYTPRRCPGGTGILPVAGWTGFTELNGRFLSCVDLSTGSDRSLWVVLRSHRAPSGTRGSPFFPHDRRFSPDPIFTQGREPDPC